MGAITDATSTSKNAEVPTTTEQVNLSTNNSEEPASSTTPLFPMATSIDSSVTSTASSPNNADRTSDKKSQQVTTSFQQQTFVKTNTAISTPGGLEDSSTTSLQSIQLTTYQSSTGSMGTVEQLNRVHGYSSTSVHPSIAICLLDQFSCSGLEDSTEVSDLCISKDDVCNSANDCRDFSDELNCEYQ